MKFPAADRRGHSPAAETLRSSERGVNLEAVRRGGRSMSEEEEDWQKVIRGLRAGDREIIGRFFREYGPSLERLAEKNLPPGMRRRIGPEDIVQSACRTFFRRAQGGEFQLEESENIWRLLCAITLTKVREQARFHSRQKRSLAHEVQVDPGGSGGSAAGFDAIAGGVSPPSAAAFAEQFQRIMASLDSEEQRVVDLKLQDFTNEDVAEQLQCSERTVRRIVKRLQSAMARKFDAG